MEQTNKTNIFDQFRFLSEEELIKVNGGHLIGSKFVKSYLHGFIIKSKLYEKLRLKAEPFDLQKYKEERLRKRLENELDDKIYVKGEKSVKGMGKGNLNKKYIDMMKEKAQRKRRDEDDEGFEGILNDDRFKGLKMDKRFNVDTENEEFRLRHPSLRKGIKKFRK